MLSIAGNVLKIFRIIGVKGGLSIIVASKKLGLTSKDIEFLKELQHELKTQRHDCQAAPRYWGVIEHKTEWGIADGYEDGYEIIFEGESLGNFNNAIQTLIADGYISDNETKNTTCLDDLNELLRDKGMNEVNTCNYRNVKRVTNETGCFLTKRACQEHVRVNHYHYTKPQTYAMTAWRNPEFERVLEILEKMDFSEVIDG